MPRISREKNHHGFRNKQRNSSLNSPCPPKRRANVDKEEEEEENDSVVERHTFGTDTCHASCCMIASIQRTLVCERRYAFALASRHARLDRVHNNGRRMHTSRTNWKHIRLPLRTRKLSIRCPLSAEIRPKRTRRILVPVVLRIQHPADRVEELEAIRARQSLRQGQRLA
jgi:hypothetical protein